MADRKITDLTELTTPADEDLLAIVDDPSGTPVTKKVTKANLFAAHLGDTTDAHDASAISFVPAGTIAATNVQTAIEEVASEAAGSHPDLAAHDTLGLATQAELDAHISDATAAHAATAVAFTPAGTIAATTVQAAIEEVASEAEGTAPLTVTFASEKDTDLVTSTGAYRWYNDTGLTLTIISVRASVGTAPTGASILVDVHKSGTTIFTTQSNRPTIAVSTNTDKADAIEVNTIADAAYFTVDIDQVGSTIAGQNLTVTITLTAAV